MRQPDHSDPAWDVLKHISYDMCLVTSAHEGKVNGHIVSYLTQSSLNPLRLIVCISLETYSYELINASRRLALHLLGKDQIDLVPTFGHRSGRDVDKFALAAVSWRPGLTGCPILEDCAGFVECEILAEVGAGDHVAYVCAIVNSGTGKWRPLLTL